MTSLDLKLIAWLQSHPVWPEVKSTAESLLEKHWQDPDVAYDEFRGELTDLVLMQDDIPPEFLIESVTRHGRRVSLIPDMEIIANEIMYSLVYGGELFSVSGEEVAGGVA